MASRQVVVRQPPHLKMFVCFTALWFILLAIFHAWPAIDIKISEMFFRPYVYGMSAQPKCGEFPLSKSPAVTVLRSILYALPFVATAMVLAALTVSCFSPRLRPLIPTRRLWLSLISLATSTGLITNLFLKSHSGRPRPIQTDLFGGKMEFMPAGSFHGACARNCTFISGEASGAGWVMCLIFLLPPQCRAIIAPPVIFTSVVTTAMRVAVGAHYASDATLGLLVSIIVFVGMLSLEDRVANR